MSSGMTEDPLLVCGGCDCGQITYTVHQGPFTPSEGYEDVSFPIVEIDHCQRCRTVSGSFVQIWYIIPLHWARINILGHERPAVDVLSESLGLLGHQGKVAGGLKIYASSENVARGFCGQCGTNLFYSRNEPGEEGTWNATTIDFTLGSLSQEDFEKTKPKSHGWWDSGVEWVKEWCRTGIWGTLRKHPTGDPRTYVEE